MGGMLAWGLFSQVAFILIKIEKNSNIFQDTLNLAVYSLFFCNPALNNAIEIHY